MDAARLALQFSGGKILAFLCALPSVDPGLRKKKSFLNLFLNLSFFKSFSNLLIEIYRQIDEEGRPETYRY